MIRNYVSGSRHEKKLRDAVERYCGIPLVESIQNEPELRVMECHLGLIPSWESGERELLVEYVGRKLESKLDLNGILTIALEFISRHQPSQMKEEDH